MTSIIDDPYDECTGAKAFTEIYFGNGDTMTWTTSTAVTSKTYLNALQSGNYLLHISSQQYAVVRKIVKQ